MGVLLWLEQALGAIRLLKQQVRYEAALNFFKQDELNLLDVIASGFRPEQVILHLKGFYTRLEENAKDIIGENIKKGRHVQEVYKEAVLDYYGRTELNSLKEKEDWITAKLNGGAA